MTESAYFTKIVSCHQIYLEQQLKLLKFPGIAYTEYAPSYCWPAVSSFLHIIKNQLRLIFSQSINLVFCELAKILHYPPSAAAMALVANPTSVWRDPNVMSASSVNSSLTTLQGSHQVVPHPMAGMGMNHHGHLNHHQLGNHHHQLGSYSNCLSPTSPGVDPIEMNHNSTTPVPTQSSSDGDIKTEDGQEIACVVCGDKSSGKHYGQFTCEGKIISSLKSR